MSKRKIIVGIFFLATVICFSFCTQTIFAQAPSVKTFVDKRIILIGEQIQYKVQASFPSNDFKVRWLSIPDSIEHFEVVDRSKIDTTTVNDITTFQQTITLTSFDSGRWNTPALAINFEPVKNGFPENVFTDSIPINVGYAPADSSNALRDIKPIMEVTVENYVWYYIAGGILLFLIIGFITWQYLKNRKKKPVQQFVAKLPPYEEAMQSLNKLEQMDLQDAEQVKQYHIGLSEIFKRYLGRKQNSSLANKTTGDILVYLSENNLSQDNIAAAATGLRVGDAVKFAKFLPPLYESENSLGSIKSIINLIEQKAGNGK